MVWLRVSFSGSISGVLPSLSSHWRVIPSLVQTGLTVGYVPRPPRRHLPNPSLTQASTAAERRAQELVAQLLWLLGGYTNNLHLEIVSHNLSIVFAFFFVPFLFPFVH